MKFLMAVGTIPSKNLESRAFWSTGLLGYPLLSTFACEKYVLTVNPVVYQTADYYEFVRRYGDVYLFRNQMFLPLGLTFSRYLPEDIFLQLPTWAKPLALLHAAVLSDKAAAQQQGLPQLSLQELKQQMRETSLPDAIASCRSTALNIRSFAQARINGTVRLDQRSILVLQTPFDPGWSASQDGRTAPVLKVDVGLLGVVLDSGEHEVELRYRPPLLFTGAAVSLASLLILVVSLWRWPRVHLPE